MIIERDAAEDFNRKIIIKIEESRIESKIEDKKYDTMNKGRMWSEEIITNNIKNERIGKIKNKIDAE